MYYSSRRRSSTSAPVTARVNAKQSPRPPEMRPNNTLQLPRPGIKDKRITHRPSNVPTHRTANCTGVCPLPITTSRSLLCPPMLDRGSSLGRCRFFAPRLFDRASFKWIFNVYLNSSCVTMEGRKERNFHLGLIEKASALLLNVTICKYLSISFERGEGKV